MPYVLPGGPGGGRPTEPCTVCTSASNVLSRNYNVGEIVDCSRCGDYSISHVTADEVGLPLQDLKQRALASYLIRKLQQGSQRPRLTSDFFRSLSRRTLPTPADASDNLLLWIAEQADGSPGKQVKLTSSDPMLLGIIGMIDSSDISWAVENLKSQGLIGGTSSDPIEKPWVHLGNLTACGWDRVEELKKAHVSSRFAFFARQFSNPELDQVFDKCLRPAVAQTGYELRPVTQRAGLVDAVIENEIRRCRFLIADLSDDNAGAYWEAGLAEGLGKDVIYICRAVDAQGEKKTHFDTSHRHTVRWGLSTLDRTANELKAVIRNTLLGDAKQDD
jgi:hypothetical protein